MKAIFFLLIGLYFLLLVVLQPSYLTKAILILPTGLFLTLALNQHLKIKESNGE